MKKTNLKKDEIWYAVQENPEDGWDYGSSDWETAREMLMNQGHGLIAEISVKDSFCLNTFRYEEL